MASLTQHSVLIVDLSSTWGPDLRTRLVANGLRVHVVNSARAALTLLATKKLDVAVLEYALDQKTSDLCVCLKHIGVPYVFTGQTAEHVPAPSYDDVERAVAAH